MMAEHYHVMLRGINRQDIFEDDEDYLQMTSIKTKMITEPHSLGQTKVAHTPDGAQLSPQCTCKVTKSFPQ